MMGPTFAGVALDLGRASSCAGRTAPSRRARSRTWSAGVKGPFFKQRRFLDDEDLQRQLDEWHEAVNTQRPLRATGVTPAARMAEERPRLRPLKVAPEDMALPIPFFVGPTGIVAHDTHSYSLPAEATGIAGTRYLQSDKVRIVATDAANALPRRQRPPERRRSMVFTTNKALAAWSSVLHDDDLRGRLIHLDGPAMRT